MSDQICYAVLCVFSYMAAGQQKKAEVPGALEHRNSPAVAIPASRYQNPNPLK